MGGKRKSDGSAMHAPASKRATTPLPVQSTTPPAVPAGLRLPAEVKDLILSHLAFFDIRNLSGCGKVGNNLAARGLWKRVTVNLLQFDVQQFSSRERLYQCVGLMTALTLHIPRVFGKNRSSAAAIVNRNFRNLVNILPNDSLHCISFTPNTFLNIQAQAIFESLVTKCSKLHKVYLPPLERNALEVRQKLHGISAGLPQFGCTIKARRKDEHVAKVEVIVHTEADKYLTALILQHHEITSMSLYATRGARAKIAPMLHAMGFAPHQKLEPVELTLCNCDISDFASRDQASISIQMIRHLQVVECNHGEYYGFLHSIANSTKGLETFVFVDIYQKGRPKRESQKSRSKTYDAPIMHILQRNASLTKLVVHLAKPLGMTGLKFLKKLPKALTLLSFSGGNEEFFSSHDLDQLTNVQCPGLVALAITQRDLTIQDEDAVSKELMATRNVKYVVEFDKMKAPWDEKRQLRDAHRTEMEYRVPFFNDEPAGTFRNKYFGFSYRYTGGRLYGLDEDVHPAEVFIRREINTPADDREEITLVSKEMTELKIKHRKILHLLLGRHISSIHEHAELMEEPFQPKGPRDFETMYEKVITKTDERIVPKVRYDLEIADEGEVREGEVAPGDEIASKDEVAPRGEDK